MPLITPEDAVERLKRGELVAIPTETVYGLAGRIDDERALRRIFEVKSRPFFDPLIVHIENKDQAKSLAREWPPVYDTLTDAFWPGPLTLIVPKTEAVSHLITAGLETVALRSPNHPIARKILQELGVPLAAPSANRFGRTSPTRAQDVIDEFQDKIPVVDGGACEVGLESTVLRAVQEGDKWRIEILRPGGVSRDQIAHVLSQKKIPHTIIRVESKATPGHTPAHYQPESPVVIVKNNFSEEDLKKYIAARLNQNIVKLQWLTLPEDPRQAAREIYHSFRLLTGPGHAICVRLQPSHLSTDWEAVLDRLLRASVLSVENLK